MKVHAEIEYNNEDGEWVHSDICPATCASENMGNSSYRNLLHKALDEWLDKSNGSGVFYISQEGFIQTNGQNGRNQRD